MYQSTNKILQRLGCPASATFHLTVPYIYICKSWLQNVEKAIMTLCRIHAESTVGPLIDYVASLISNTGLDQVTKDEYGIFLTPEGELYDHTIIEK